jgi:plastocyanin
MAMERKWTLLVVAAIAIAVVLVLALIFMGDDYGEDFHPGEREVWIDNMAFEPFNLTVSVGANVTWLNNDGSHTVTSDEVGLFDSGTMTTGETFQFTFTEVGQYFYHCALHPEMHGVVTVVA